MQTIDSITGCVGDPAAIGTRGRPRVCGLTSTAPRTIDVAMFGRMGYGGE